MQAVALPRPRDPDRRQRAALGAFQPARPARFVSAKDVLDGRGRPDRFEGRLVLIGTSAVGLLDIKTTPVEPRCRASRSTPSCSKAC